MELKVQRRVFNPGLELEFIVEIGLEVVLFVPVLHAEGELDLPEPLVQVLVVAHGDELHEHPSERGVGAPDPQPGSVCALLLAPVEGFDGVAAAVLAQGCERVLLLVGDEGEEPVVPVCVSAGPLVEGDRASAAAAVDAQILGGLLLRRVREVLDRLPAFDVRLDFQQVGLERRLVLGIAHGVVEEVEIDPAREGLHIPLLLPGGVVGILAHFLELPHQQDGDPVGVGVERADRPDGGELLPVGVNLVAYPRDGRLCERDEVEAREKQLREVLLRVVSVVGHHLGRPHPKCAELPDGVGERNHVRQVAGLLGERHGLAGGDGIEGEELHCLQSVMGLVEPVPGFVLVLGVRGHRGRVVGDGVILRQRPDAGGEEVLAQALVPPGPREKLVVDSLRHAVGVGDGVVVLPGLDARKRLTAGRQQVAGQGDDLLRRAEVGRRVDGVVYARFLPDVVDDVHHADMHPRGRQKRGFSPGRSGFRPLGPRRDRLVAVFWDFGDELRGENPVVVLLRIIDGFPLQDIRVAVFLWDPDGRHLGFEGCFAWHG